MAVTITGVLKDGLGQPVTTGWLMVKAQRTSHTVVAQTVAQIIPDNEGQYRVAVEPGAYSVTLCVSGQAPAYVGDIHVHADSPSGTLNDFLGAVTETDLRPAVIQRFETMLSTVTAQAQALSQVADWVTSAETARTAAESSAQSSAAQAGVSAEHVKQTEQHVRAAESAAEQASTAAKTAKTQAASAKSAAQRASEAETAAQQSAQEAQQSQASVATLAAALRTEAQRATQAAASAGKSAYQLWLERGNTGNVQAFLTALRGARGEPGQRGERGPKGDPGRKGDPGPVGKAMRPTSPTEIGAYAQAVLWPAPEGRTRSLAQYRQGTVLAGSQIRHVQMGPNDVDPDDPALPGSWMVMGGSLVVRIK